MATFALDEKDSGTKYRIRLALFQRWPVVQVHLEFHAKSIQPAQLLSVMLSGECLLFKRSYFFVAATASGNSISRASSAES